MRRVTSPAYRKALKIIEGRSAGMNKEESRLYAGYSPSISKTNAPELTKAYAVALKSVLDENSFLLSSLSEEIKEAIRQGDLEKLTLPVKVDIFKKLAEVHKILNPQVTVKEETDKDGNKKVTKWGTATITEHDTPPVDWNKVNDDVTRLGDPNRFRNAKR